MLYELAAGVGANCGAAGGADMSGSGIVVASTLAGVGGSGIGAGDGARIEKLEKEVGPMEGGALLYDVSSTPPVADKPSKASEME